MLEGLGGQADQADKGQQKKLLLDWIQRDDVTVLDFEALTEEIPPKNGFRRHRRTGMYVITALRPEPVQEEEALAVPQEA